MLPKTWLLLFLSYGLIAACPAFAETPPIEDPLTVVAKEVEADSNSPTPPDCPTRFQRFIAWAKVEAEAMKKAPPIDRKALSDRYDKPLQAFLPQELQDKIAQAVAKGEDLVFSEAEVASMREAMRDQLDHYYMNFLANDPHLLDMESLIQRASASPDNPLNVFENFKKLKTPPKLSSLSHVISRPLSGPILDFQLAAGPAGGVLTNGEMKTVMTEKKLPSHFIVKTVMELIKKHYGKIMTAGSGLVFAQPLKKPLSLLTGSVSSVGDVGVSRALAQKNADSFALLGKKMMSPEQKQAARAQMEKVLGKMTDEQFDALVTKGIQEMMQAHFFEEASNIPLMRVAREGRQEVFGLFNGMMGSVSGAKAELSRVAKATVWVEASDDPNKAQMLKGLADAKAAALKQLEWNKQQLMYLLIDRAYGLSGATPAMNPKLREAFELAVSPTQVDGELIWKTHYLEAQTQLKAFDKRVLSEAPPAPQPAVEPAPAPAPEMPPKAKPKKSRQR